MKLVLNTNQPSTNSPAPVSSLTPSSGLKLNLGRLHDQAEISSQHVGNTMAKLPKPAQSKGKTSKSKKRGRDSEGDLVNVSPAKKQALTKRTSSKIRLSSSSTRAPSVLKLKTGRSIPSASFGATRLKLKSRGKAPFRPSGVGYDSEAEDAEIDPAIEENFILRMLPGLDCEYVKKAIEERRIGTNVTQGGAHVSLRFFSKDGRRAVVKVGGNLFAAVLVDLPCITETMKSWDKRGWWKAADIGQMLLVICQIENEDDARHVTLPKDIDDKTWQWPHGLCPPMHNVRRRRFRKRVSYRTIEAAEEEVERLIKADEHAKIQRGTTTYEVLDLDRLESQEEESADGDYDLDTDRAESTFGNERSEQAVLDVDEDEETAAKRLQMELDLGVDDEEEHLLDAANLINAAVAPSNDALPVSSDGVRMTVETSPSRQLLIRDGGEQIPADLSRDDEEFEESKVIEIDADVISEEFAEEEDERDEREADEDDDDEDEDEDEDEEEEEDDDDDDDDDGGVADEDESEWAKDIAQQRTEIAELKEELSICKAKLLTTINQTLRQRLLGKISAVESDLEVKRRAIGDSDDDM